MARKPRIEFPGAFYHVIARGNNKQRIFINDDDYKYFLERLGQYRERFNFTLYAYVLMPNHIHLLIETDKFPLSRIMQALQFTYTQNFNRRHKKTGHLFQGRYKAILCQKESYLLELIRYIILNPVRGRLIKKPVDWRWSSYYDIFKIKENHIVSLNDVLKLFGNKPQQATNALHKHINDGLPADHNKSYYKLKDQRILGEDEFAQAALKLGDSVSGDFEYYDVAIEDLVKIVAEMMGLETGQVLSFSRERLGAKARGVVAYISKTMCGKTAKVVSKYFGRSEPVLSKSIRHIESEINEMGELEKILQGVTKFIKDNYRPCLVKITTNK